jgi:sec-independent protein translocase protein TatC
MALVPFPTQGSDRRADDDDLDRLDSEESELDAGGRMSFLEHLDELRKRIIYAVIAIFAGFLIACLFIDRIFEFIMRPLQQALPDGGKLVFTEPTEAFVLWIQIAAIAGLLLALPVVFLQLWLFIAPGLYTHEKKYALPFVFLSTICFVGGAAFSHYVVFPLAWQFFASFTTDYMTFMPRIQPAFGLYMKLLLIFGAVFQMPTLVLFLARMGLVTAGFMARNIKYAILIIAIASAVLTPTGDAFVMTAMGVPLFLLYVLSIGLAWIFGKKRTAEEA